MECMDTGVTGILLQRFTIFLFPVFYLFTITKPSSHRASVRLSQPPLF